MLLGILGSNLLGNLLTGKVIYRVRKGKGKGVLRGGEGILRAGYGRPSNNNNANNKMDF